MQTHQIQPKTKQRKARRIGRGGKKGTYSGRGIKGQSARTGARFQPRVRELFKRYPKLRGYRFSSKAEYAILNIGSIEKHFAKGETVNPSALAKKKLVQNMRGRVPKVKILGSGEITKGVRVEGCLLSRPAKEKIEKAGGAVF